MTLIARAALIALVCAPTLAVAAAAEKPDLAAALSEFQLAESSRSVKELVPAWVMPKKLVVVVDKPERTVWLQQAMPAGTTVIGVSHLGLPEELPSLIGQAVVGCPEPDPGAVGGHPGRGFAG